MSEGGSYDPHKIEPEVRALWERGDWFHAEPDPQRAPYSIVIPPPNVTGALHLGHALNNTLQDILIRTKRMQGYNACWIPGTDHAGIATQAVVEKRLKEEEGLTRHEIGREGLVQRIWAWKDEYEQRILSQLRRMGCSCDWQRTRFTLDEVCARAVYETFFRMFRDGLIFRGTRLVNWDTQLQTAVSDDEVYHETVRGSLWHVRYPVLGEGTEARRHQGTGGREQGTGNREQGTEGGSGIGDRGSGAAGEAGAAGVAPANGRCGVRPANGRSDAVSAPVGSAAVSPARGGQSSALPDLSADQITAAISRATSPDAQAGRDYLIVATTRPETMLADVAVAVHPDDERYKHLIGRHVLLPLMNRPIPVIADPILVDPKFGTGCVKVTPGHDPNDYECGQRHGLPMLSMMRPDGTVSEVGRSDGAAKRRSDGATKRRSDEGQESEKAGRREGGHVAQPPSAVQAGAEPAAGEQTGTPARAGSADGADGQGDTGAAPAGGAPAGGAGISPAGGAGILPGGGAGILPAGGAGILPAYDYVGLTMDAARKQVVADLEALGLLDKTEPYETEVGHSDRSKAPIQPLLSEQWFVKMDALAEMAMEAVRDGRVQFFPARFAKSYLDWLGEKRDWCISRQLWWGHRIPVWTKRLLLTEGNWVNEICGSGGIDSLFEQNWGEAPDVLHWGVYRVRDGVRIEDWRNEFMPVVSQSEGEYELQVVYKGSDPSVLRLLDEAALVQDPDVLDTWFSSALWPFSTFGWPDGEARRHEGTEARREETRSPIPAPRSPSALDYFYPTNVLSTARDIISLWVARMVIDSLYLNGRVPFSHVLIHPTILDGRGRRMSKSAGNGLDPVDLIEHYGADAMRYSLAALAGETQDVRIPVEYLCPHCQALTPQKDKHLGKPIVQCEHCKKDFATRLASQAKIDELGLGLSLSERFDDGRRFANKLWQVATGFVLPNLQGTGSREQGTGNREQGTGNREQTAPASAPVGSAGVSPVPMDGLALEDRWILSRLTACIEEVDRRRERYQFSDMINALYAFFWSDFCDWYVELVKPRLYEGHGGAEARRHEGTARRHEATEARRHEGEGSGSGDQGSGSGDRVSGIRDRGSGSGDRGSDVAAAPRGGRSPAEASGSSDAARRVLAHVLDQTLRLLHPVMPFITERLWAMLRESGTGNREQGTEEEQGSGIGDRGEGSRGTGNRQQGTEGTGGRQISGLRESAPALCVAAWPRAVFPRDLAVEEEIKHTQDVIRSIRDIRAQVNALRSQAGEKALRALPQAIVRAEGRVAQQLRGHLPMLRRLGGADEIVIDPAAAKPPQSASRVLAGIEVYVPLAGLADPAAERQRLIKQRDQLQRGLAGVSAKLANEKFVRNAPADVVASERQRAAELRERLEAVERNLAELG